MSGAVPLLPPVYQPSWPLRGNLNLFSLHYTRLAFLCVGRDSSVGIATRYGLGDPGIEYRWGRDFPHLSKPALGPTQSPVQWVTGLSWC